MQNRDLRLTLALVVLALAPMALPVHGQVCANIPLTVPLYVNQTVPVGTVTVSNDVTNLYITYMVTPGYIIDQTNLQVASSLAGIPVNSSGDPRPSKFTYRTTNQPGVTSFTYTVPRTTPPNTRIYIAANAIVQQVSTSCGGEGDGEGDHHDGEGDHHSSYSGTNSSHDDHEGEGDHTTTCGGGSESGDGHEGDDSSHHSSTSSSNHSSGDDHHDDGDDEHHHSSQCCGPKQSAWAGNQPFPGSSSGAAYFTYVVNCGIPE